MVVSLYTADDLTGRNDGFLKKGSLLTLISTIFIPLTFIVGVYGMNFEHMPELHYPWAYPACWGVMIVITIAMLLYFKKKKWL